MLKALIERYTLLATAVTVLATGLTVAALTLGNTGCGGEECLEHGENCSTAYLEANGKEDLSCCSGEVCCALAGGSGVPSCQSSGSCE